MKLLLWKKRREEFVRVNIIFLCILYGSVIDSGESTTKQKAKSAGASETAKSCVLYAKNVDELERRKFFVCGQWLCSFGNDE